MPPDHQVKTPLREYNDNDWDADFHDKSKFSNNGKNKTYNSNQQSKPLVYPGPAIQRKPVAPARPADPSFSADNPDLIQTGMKIEHATFGPGKVLHIEGVSPNRKATVFFQETSEEKQLLLKFAKLRIVK
jgi:DNA helicase-2/ATP-dependent DNA helicase PcrA